MIYKITYIKREIVNAYLPNQSVNDSEEMTIKINAIDVNEARKLFYSDENNIHCFIRTIERTTPKHKSKGAKTNQKELVKRQEKKLLKKEKTKRWLKKHPESNLAKKIFKKSVIQDDKK